VQVSCVSTRVAIVAKIFSASKNTLNARIGSMGGLSKSGAKKAATRLTQANADPSPAQQGAGVKKTPSTKPASKKKSDKGKGSHYSSEEIDLIMDIIEEVLPSGEYMWDRVAKEYNDRKPRGSACRDMESIRNKFRKFKNEKKPTGDPNCPEHVKRAKTIQRAIDNHVGAQEIDDDQFSDDESDGSEHSNSGNSILSGSKRSSDAGGPRSPLHSANWNESPVLPRGVLQGGNAVGDLQQDYTRNTIIPETLPFHFNDGEDAQPISVSSASSSQQKNDDAESQKKSNPVRPTLSTRAPPPIVRIPLRLGVGEQQVHEYLSEALHKNKKEKSTKRDRSKEKGIPEHPVHSKKASLAREIKDVNDEFKRDKEDHMLRFQAAKREQDLRHFQEMERIRSEREVSDRRYEAEMAARREERALAERRFDAESTRQTQAMNMQMGLFAALLGGRGISPIVQPSSLPSGAASLDHAPNT
jgi:hypothetical protein